MMTSIVKLTVTMSLILASSAYSFASPQGGSDPGGGSDVGLEFSSSLTTALMTIKGTDLAAEVDLDQLQLAIQSATILAVDQPLIVKFNGVDQESVAENFPDSGNILVNKARFSQIQDPHLREALALHELLSLKLLERTGYYALSGQYLAHFGIPVLQLKQLLGNAPPNSGASGNHPPDGPMGNHPPG